jgi:hypothetical protein
VMKNVILVFCSCELAIQLSDSNTTTTTREKRIRFFIIGLHSFMGLTADRESILTSALAAA